MSYSFTDVGKWWLVTDDYHHTSDVDTVNSSWIVRVLLTVTHLTKITRVGLHLKIKMVFRYNWSFPDMWLWFLNEKKPSNHNLRDSFDQAHMLKYLTPSSCWGLNDSCEPQSIPVHMELDLKSKATLKTTICSKAPIQIQIYSFSNM